MLTEVGKKEKKKKGKLSQPKILKNFLYFLVSFFPELKPHKITPPQCTHSHPAQSGSAEVHKHFLFHFFYKKVTNIFLAFQKASGLEDILVKCQQRNSLIIQTALFLSSLGVCVGTVLWMELQNSSEPQRGRQSYGRETFMQEKSGVTGMFTHTAHQGLSPLSSITLRHWDLSFPHFKDTDINQKSHMIYQMFLSYS